MLSILLTRSKRISKNAAIQTCCRICGLLLVFSFSIEPEILDLVRNETAFIQYATHWSM